MTPDSPLLAPDLAAGFLSAASERPDHVALELGGAQWTYQQLRDEAGAIAAALRAAGLGAGRVGVFASRSLTAYAGSLAVFGAGAAHVALNPAHPVARGASIAAQAELSTLLVGAEGLSALSALLSAAPGIQAVVAPHSADLSALAGAHPGVRFWDADAVAALAAPLEAPPVAWGDLAYLVFTSGSTGAPKGVPISHGNLSAYMRNVRELAAPVADDRVATTYELTFDIALHDMFMAWWSGATLCVVSARQLTAPARFIRKQRITYWFSVASAAMLMEQQGTLRPGVFPLLRISMLCGEPLPGRSAARWAEAAPNSVLYNVYGPTETTMEMAFYPWDPERSLSRCRRGVVPIGIPFDDHDHILLDTSGAEITGAGQGELLLRGPQVGQGYWGLPEKTAKTFVTIPGHAGTWYRTGDRIERDEEGMYHFVSRIDFMVKLRGHRIELGEVEAATRDAAETSLVAVLPHPMIGGNAQGLVAFVSGGPELDAAGIRARLAERLPSAMIPDRIERLESLPLNANRKIDRRALAALLED